MQVQFREFNPFDVWFWLEFSTVPSNSVISNQLSVISG
ncbi:DUF3531 family protein [Microcystis panniformis]|uniref:Uncharacterized protein n=1 Tax=Microcystis panniformis FACHB-1757 TaxID=1638788 RepID=A0A0K1RWD1_9CHRO|nr:hypothetical protein VL20_1013 [Microcystis panniformis FACHB-1757]AKV66201.1 hypothetical protein VL20_1014 [Microcystis panniformis FACHB-1757]AKV66202.1 hypothetical protein VL20_1015 [Microcystis panniformis FACHB-1757]AKV66203.1 hypothetical protein VL20_1016 [Microcystis panniformis FACHB-1757]AKV66204.1 hypothetical protein VL20_1017 [Microcystis panniformis FACHB-1757]